MWHIKRRNEEGLERAARGHGPSAFGGGPRQMPAAGQHMPQDCWSLLPGWGLLTRPAGWPLWGEDAGQARPPPAPLLLGFCSGAAGLGPNVCTEEPQQLALGCCQGAESQAPREGRSSLRPTQCRKGTSQRPNAGSAIYLGQEAENRDHPGKSEQAGQTAGLTPSQVQLCGVEERKPPRTWPTRQDPPRHDPASEWMSRNAWVGFS